MERMPNEPASACSILYRLSQKRRRGIPQKHARIQEHKHDMARTIRPEVNNHEVVLSMMLLKDASCISTVAIYSAHAHTICAHAFRLSR